MFDFSEKLKPLPLVFKDSRAFASQGIPGSKKANPSRNPALHGLSLRQSLDNAWNEQSDAGIIAFHANNEGLYLEFKGEAGHELAIESLENTQGKHEIRLCSVVTRDNTTYATVFVPNKKKDAYLKKLATYAEGALTTLTTHMFPKYERYKDIIAPYFVDIEAPKHLQLMNELSEQDFDNLRRQGASEKLCEKLKRIKPKNAALLESVNSIKKAIAKSLWTDSLDLFPTTDRIWCEIWLRYGKNDALEREIETIANSLGCPIKPEKICFPERMVKLVHCNGSELEQFLTQHSCVAEFRKAKTVASFWSEMSNKDQADWVEDLLSRVEYMDESFVVACILDGGVNNGHPLLSKLLSDEAMHTVKPEWGIHDHDRKGHGTKMAGVVAYGNLKHCLESDDPIMVSYELESSKILPPDSYGANAQELWGHFTKQGVSLAEISAPTKQRILCMAVTSLDNNGGELGKPSSWSGALDEIISGSEDDVKRLFIVSAGNCNAVATDGDDYPERQKKSFVQDPAQAWNAITVGAYTELTTIEHADLAGYEPVAKVGELSPFSSTSFEWDKKWPIKPDVVFEGGNIAIKDGFLSECEDLSLLSLSHKPTETHFDTHNMTSAATALATNFAAKLQSEYPEYWPETVRALMIHSAEWTEGLRNQFPEANPSNKVKELLKACGYGVPNLDKALYCARNYLTLVAQATIQPYKIANKKPTVNQMHVYELPWPKDILDELGETQVRMRVTLSYYVEPSPGEIGWTSRYRYPSHLLRFALNSPYETEDTFIKRINIVARDDDYESGDGVTASKYWVIGQNRDKGSIHSDIWVGTAAELATSNLLAVVPKIGWWKERDHFGKVEKEARYSLIVSIETPGQGVDIYTPVATKITQSVVLEL